MFETTHVDADQAQPQHLWRSFNELLGRGCAPTSIVADTDLHEYFDNKINDVRAATVGANSPVFASVGCELQVLSPTTPADVIALERSLHDK